MHRINLFLLGLVAALSVSTATPSFADILYYVGNGGATAPIDAGGGNWTAANLSDTEWATTATSPGSSPWLSGSDAQFIGTNGGTVTVGSESLAVSSVTYASTAGAFTVVNNGNVTVDGAVRRMPAF